jgi:hypothetical protein
MLVTDTHKLIILKEIISDISDNLSSRDEIATIADIKRAFDALSTIAYMEDATTDKEVIDSLRSTAYAEIYG